MPAHCLAKGSGGKKKKKTRLIVIDVITQKTLVALYFELEITCKFIKN